MLTHWILICLAAVALEQWGSTTVDAANELDRVEKELVKVLANALVTKGRSNQKKFPQRDDGANGDGENGENNDGENGENNDGDTDKVDKGQDVTCEEECADIDEDSKFMVCMRCVCSVHSSLAGCNDVDQRKQNNQPVVRNFYLAKKTRIDTLKVPTPTGWWFQEKVENKK